LIHFDEAILMDLKGGTRFRFELETVMASAMATSIGSHAER
jgi:hypothetical protein